MRTHRKDEIPHFSSRIPHTELCVGGKFETEVAQHAARIDNRARTVTAETPLKE
jgi:hypothetical protein